MAESTLTTEQKVAKLRNAIILRSQGKLTEDQSTVLNRIIGNAANKDIVKLALAEPEKAGFSIFGGLIGPEDITQAMFGMSPEQLRELRDAPPMAGETPTTAGLRTFFAGTGAAASDVASSFTSPASIALGGAGAVAQTGGRAGLAARALLTTAGAAGGGLGAADILSGLTDTEASLPERTERVLSGGAAVAGAGPAAQQVGRRLTRIQALREVPALRRLQRTTPEIQEASLAAGTGIDPKLAKEALPALRAAAKDKGIKASDFSKEGGMEKFSEVLQTAKQTLDRPVQQALRRVGRQEVDGAPIADAIEARVDSRIQKLRPEEAAAMRDAAAKFRRRFTLDELDAERQALNADLSSFFNKSALKQASDVAKTNAGRLIAKTARDSIAQTEYTFLENNAGVRPGTFRDLKSQESKLLRIEEKFNKVAERTRIGDARFRALGFTGRLTEAAPTGIAFESARVPLGRALFSVRPSRTERNFLQSAFAPTATDGRLPPGTTGGLRRLFQPPSLEGQHRLRLTRGAIIGLLNALADEEQE